jgi:hypothetical protein
MHSVPQQGLDGNFLQVPYAGGVLQPQGYGLNSELGGNVMPPPPQQWDQLTPEQQQQYMMQMQQQQMQQQGVQMQQNVPAFFSIEQLPPDQRLV